MTCIFSWHEHKLPTITKGSNQVLLLVKTALRCVGLLSLQLHQRLELPPGGQPASQQCTCQNLQAPVLATSHNSQHNSSLTHEHEMPPLLRALWNGWACILTTVDKLQLRLTACDTRKADLGTSLKAASRGGGTTTATLSCSTRSFTPSCKSGHCCNWRKPDNSKF